jgi:hypothetical protein
MAINIFGDAPQSLTGLLGEQATNDLRKKALTTGLINAAIGYIAQPKNQGYGSVLPYVGRALMAGQQGAQGVYEGAITDWERQQKIAEMKRQQQQRESFDVASKNLYTTRPAQFETMTTPGGYAPAQSEIQAGQVAPNFGMTRLPDVTSQRQIAPESQELNQQALQQMMLSGDPRATSYLSGLKTLRELTTAPKEDFITLSEGQIAVSPTSGKTLSGREKEQEEWSDPFIYQGQAVQRSLKNNQLRQAVTQPARTEINVGGKGVAPKKIDEKFADQFIDWTVGGGFSDVQKSLTQLGSAAQTLESSPEGTITGKVIGYTPDSVLKSSNPKATATKEAVEEVVQRNLRLILGAQFTEKEGERLIARAYNKGLSQKENARRVKLLQEQIFDAAQAKQDAIEYYNENGTIYGWKGKMFNSTTDFLNEYNKRLAGKKTSSVTPSGNAPSGVDLKVWNAMTPEERALWQN